MWTESEANRGASFALEERVLRVCERWSLHFSHNLDADERSFCSRLSERLRGVVAARNGSRDDRMRDRLRYAAGECLPISRPSRPISPQNFMGRDITYERDEGGDHQCHWLHRALCTMMCAAVGASDVSGKCSNRLCGHMCHGSKCFRSRQCEGVGLACERYRVVSPLLRLSPQNTLGRCAVVSSSDVLLAHELGAEIDRFDEIFRVNMSPLEGFERVVGSRTTFVVTNTPSWMSKNDFVSPSIMLRDYFTDAKRAVRPTILVQDPLTASESVKCGFHHTTLSFRRRVETCLKSCERLHTFSCRALDRALVEDAWRAICGAASPNQHNLAPSSGLIAVVYAAAKCQAVSLFGFAYTNSTGHYYAPERRVGPELHGRLETSIFHIWRDTHPNLTIVASGQEAGLVLKDNRSHRNNSSASARAYSRRRHDNTTKNSKPNMAHSPQTVDLQQNTARSPRKATMPAEPPAAASHHDVVRHHRSTTRPRISASSGHRRSTASRTAHLEVQVRAAPSNNSALHRA